MTSCQSVLVLKISKLFSEEIGTDGLLKYAAMLCSQGAVAGRTAEVPPLLTAGPMFLGMVRSPNHSVQWEAAVGKGQ